MKFNPVRPALAQSADPYDTDWLLDTLGNTQTPRSAPLVTPPGLGHVSQ